MDDLVWIVLPLIILTHDQFVMGVRTSMMRLFTVPMLVSHVAGTLASVMLAFTV